VLGRKKRFGDEGPEQRASNYCSTSTRSIYARARSRSVSASNVPQPSVSVISAEEKRHIQNRSLNPCCACTTSAARYGESE
jgi:hypothetical protein